MSVTNLMNSLYFFQCKLLFVLLICLPSQSLDAIKTWRAKCNRLQTPRSSIEE